MRRTDRGTVSMLQLKAPGLSREDLAALEKPFQAGTIFPAITDGHHRREIWNNLQNQKRLIPSLWSLFEDAKFLKGPAKIMRRLFPRTSLTTYQAAERIFTGRHQRVGEVVLQESEQSFRSEKMPAGDQFRIGYWQLWLFTWRHFVRLGQGCPRKEEGEETPVPEEPDQTLWYWFGTLADKIGFESENITEMLSSDPDRENAGKALLIGRCPRHFTYDRADFDRFQSQIVDMYKTAKLVVRSAVQPALLTSRPGETPQRRCGRIFSRSYEGYRDSLFFDSLNDPTMGEGEGISSLCVRLWIFSAFFVQDSHHGSSDAELSDGRHSDKFERSEASGANETISGKTSDNSQTSQIDSESVVNLTTGPESLVANDVARSGVAQHPHAAFLNSMDGDVSSHDHVT